MIFKEAVPLLPSGRRDFILMVAGTSTINPLIILSWLIIEKKIDDGGSDTAFRKEVKAFAEDMLTQYMESTDMSHSNSNIGSFTLLKVLGDEYARLQRFLAVYNLVSQVIDEEQDTFDTNRLHSTKKGSQKTNQKEQEPEETLIMPYPPGECWNIGKINSLTSLI